MEAHHAYSDGIGVAATQVPTEAGKLVTPPQSGVEKPVCTSLRRHEENMTYTATIISTGLRLRETRIIADLLLQGVDDQAWKEAILDQNILHMGSVETTKRSARLIRTRLEPLGEGLWRMVRDGGLMLATQAALAGTIKNSRLLGDFMDITLREQRSLFAERLNHTNWTDYIDGCRGRDPDMPHWSDGTVARLRSVVFTMLVEAEYLKDTRSLLLQNVFVDSELADYLRERDERYVLRCLEVME
jgi:hypothetical protein